MPKYKKTIFIKAIEVRLATGEGTVKDIVDTYTKLSNAEKEELLSEFETK